MSPENYELDFAPGFQNGARRHSNLSELEKNCNQLFVKAPALTREFFEKINNEVVPAKTAVFGYEMNTRRLIGLILLFTFSTLGTITMWFTNAYERRVNSMMVISDESPLFNLWRAPPARPIVKFYVFNYTNVDEYERGYDKKLHVRELGPYVYQEELERVNVRFSKVDGTVSYQEKRSYQFREDLSVGSKDDVVVIPNVPMLAGASWMKNRNFLMRIGYNGMLKAMSVKPFINNVKVDSLVTGYEDPLYELSKNYMKFEDMRVFERFGLLVWKQGTQPDVYTINTGAHGIKNLGQMEKYNGQTHYDLWGSQECNSVKTSDGILFSRELVQKKKDISFFIPQMCRKITVKFAEEARILDNKIPVYRYTAPLDTFDSSTSDNQCYCNGDSCGPKGVFNATKCTFGAPFFYSWPNFQGADPELSSAVSIENQHPFSIEDSFLDLQPEYGLLLQGTFKVQLNVRVERSFGMTQLNHLEDGLMLPMVKLDFGMTEKEMPQEVVDIIFQMTFTIKNLELGLKYGCLLASTVTLACVLLVLKRHRTARSRLNSMRRPIRIDT